MRWAFAAVVLLACGKTGQVKTDGPPPKPIAWLTDENAAAQLAATTHKRGLVFVGAEWDTAAKELEHETFVDPEVRRLVNNGYIPLAVDATDDESPVTRRQLDRFKILGDPSLIIFEPDFKTELYRLNEYVSAQHFASVLRYAGTEDNEPEPRAKAAYERNRALLTNIREQIFAHPFLGATRFPTLPDCWRQPSPAKESCLAAEEEQRKQQSAEHDQFEREFLPKLLAGTPILSLRANRYSEQNHYAFYSRIGPYEPEQKAGTRNLPVGARLDEETKIGWGEYATFHRSFNDVTQGDHELHRGIEVAWQRGDDVMTVVLLADGFRRPGDWN